MFATTVKCKFIVVLMNSWFRNNAIYLLGCEWGKVPRITGLTPRSGPTDGGTLITLLGEHLDAGSLLTVTIGNGKRCVHPTR